MSLPFKTSVIATLVLAFVVTPQLLSAQTPSDENAIAATVETPPAGAPLADLPSASSPPKRAASPPAATPDAEEEIVVEEPWDYSPYRVLVWIDSDTPRINPTTLAKPLSEFFDRQFAAVWRVTYDVMPPTVASVARRSMADMKFDVITGADPVIAIKKTHSDASRLRAVQDFPQYVKKVWSTAQRSEDVRLRTLPESKEDIEKLFKLVEDIDGDVLSLADRWADPETEALLVPRGMAQTFKKPEAKIISLPVTGLVMEATSKYDKIFVVSLSAQTLPMQVRVIELDTLMRVFGPVVSSSVVDESTLPNAIGTAVIDSFAPIVRIDDATQKEAFGLVRAGGLILDDHSPAQIHFGDVLIPMVRKDDRSGKPLSVGQLPFSYLIVYDPEVRAKEIAAEKAERAARKKAAQAEEQATAEKAAADSKKGEDPKKDAPAKKKAGGKDSSQTSGTGSVVQLTAAQSEPVASETPAPPQASDAPGPSANDSGASALKGEVTLENIENASRVSLDIYAGRPGGLQGRSNPRTFRRALKVRPHLDETMIRMHVRGRVNEPLIGYELYEKSLKTKEMTFLGRTDWNGRFWLKKTEDPLRLLYVKNGGAILARLPIVPGQSEIEVVDMTGDDLRLQAEAYIRGVQNTIVDLIAIRELLAARVRLRLTKGDMPEAEKLLEVLRNEPSSENIANDMGKRQAEFLQILGNANPSQAKMIDQMFSITRELLVKNINSKLLRDIEADYITAKANNGRLPPKTEDEEKQPQAAPPPPVEETAAAN